VCLRPEGLSSFPAQGKQRMNVAMSFALLAFLQAAGGGGGLAMLPILLIIPVLYLVMIRPQQKRQKQWQCWLRLRPATG
jgi:DNA-binding transcriptional LysR family regulator